MAGSISNIFKVPELRRRIMFTLGILAVYRVGVFITIPGVNRVEMQHVVTKGGKGSFLGMFDMFSGGALEQLSIFTLGIMPYVTSSIVMQLLTVVVPKLDQLNKEGEQGRRKINQYTRYGTILVAAVQAYFIANYVESLASKVAPRSSPTPGLSFHLMTVLTLTTGTAFIMWLGEQITDRGIGNGSSMIIFAGIVAAMPDAITQFLAGGSGGNVGGLTVLFMVFLVVVTIAAICYFERAQRRIPVQYTKRQVGRKMYSGAQSFLPLKVNVSGVIPPIFASSILMFPGQIANMSGSGWMQEFASVFHQADWRYNATFTILVVFFAFFYTSVVFNPVDVADNLEEVGGFIPGHSPRQEHRAVHREGADPHHLRRRALPVGGLHDPGAAPEVHERAVPVRRHRPPDRRRCRARHRATDRVAPHHAQLRRLRGPKGPRVRGRVAQRQ